MPSFLRRATVFLLLLALAPVTGHGEETEEPSKAPTTTPAEASRTACGQVAPDFTLTRVDGSTFSLEEQRGKVTLINFFATWCPPCIEEMPHLQAEVFERFEEEHFTLLCVAREEKNAELPRFAKKRGLDLPMAGDPTREVYAQYAEHTIPRNVVVGPDGTILFQSYGFEREDFDRMIEVIERNIAALNAS